MQNGVTWTIWNEMKDGESSSLQVSFLSSPTETLWRGVPEAPSSLLLTPAESDLNSNPPFWPPPPSVWWTGLKKTGVSGKTSSQFVSNVLSQVLLLFFPSSRSSARLGRFCFRKVRGNLAVTDRWWILQFKTKVKNVRLRVRGGGVEVLFPMSVCGGCEILSDSSRRRSGRSWS